MESMRKRMVFDIGRKGNQNFSLAEREKVSDLHARITVDGDTWFIEDLGSVNGTYIVNQNGDIVQVRRKRITAFTRVILADTTAMGYSFFPYHLTLGDPKDYREEFRHVVFQYQKKKQERAQLEENIKLRRVRLSLIPVAVSCLTGVILRATFRDNPNVTFMIIGVMSAVTASLNILVTWYNNKDQSMKAFTERMQRTVMCPQCGKLLSDYDMTNQICPFCKVHT